MLSLKTQDLHFSYTLYGTEMTPILRGVDLQVEKGELVAVRGPSGSGKSTLLYLLSGLLGPYQGKIQVLGRDLETLTETERAVFRNQHIGFIFQQFYLLPKLTLLENIQIPSFYSPRSEGSKERALELAKRLGLSERLKHYPNQLSGGQQQRVAIARALFNNPQVLLADEPTGSLDTTNSAQILQILRETVQEGRSALVITHDPEVAAQCDRTILFRDGKVEQASEKVFSQVPGSLPECSLLSAPTWSGIRKMAVALLPLAGRNLLQNKVRSFLTMLGIVIGIASILSMLTIGKFTERKILESYAELGVNTLALFGHPNWEMKATDRIPSIFQQFHWKRDIQSLLQVFPQIERVTPTMMAWDNRANYGGKTLDSEVRVMGVSADGLEILNRSLLMGTGFSPVHIQQRMNVCIIGYEIFQRLFGNINPIGEIIYVTQQQTSYGCRVLGVTKSITTNKEWNKPNLQIIVPYTFFQSTSDPWNSRIKELAFQIKAGEDVEKVGKGIKSFLSRKYGKSGRFIVGSDSVLIAQMKRFLRLFTMLLGVIALVSVAVGGIGITNMMLVSVSERFKEIGVRKAFGATHINIRIQYLLESILLCSIGGVLGLVLGFSVYQLAIYGAAQLIPSLKFEWVIDPVAVAISCLSVLAVGILSGILPALKAERLQVIDALRSD